MKLKKYNKEPRPDIPKLEIVKIGTFSGDVMNGDWSFNANSLPNSVGHYKSRDWYLVAGYTLEELKAISTKQK